MHPLLPVKPFRTLSVPLSRTLGASILLTFFTCARQRFPNSHSQANQTYGNGHP